MLMLYFLGGPGLPQLKMLLEIIAGWIGFVVVFWMILLIINEIKSKLQRRRYKEENDPGKITEPITSGIGIRTTGNTNQGEPVIQDAIEHAKQELLQSGTSGVDNDDTGTTVPDKPDA